MNFQQLKWCILLLPTLVVGLWEYIRHEYLLSYVSMEMGNWLTPLIVLLITITLLHRLFLIYENMQEQLKKERAQKAILQERERIARDLHDDIAQSLFLCSVHTNRLKQKQPDPEWMDLDKSLRYIHDHVRDLIVQLKTAKLPSYTHWRTKWEKCIAQFEAHSGIQVNAHIDWDEDRLSHKEKKHLTFCLQEALTNILKHAQATEVSIKGSECDGEFCLSVIDNGIGFASDPFAKPNCFGLSIIRERCQELDAQFQLHRAQNHTWLTIEKRREIS